MATLELIGVSKRFGANIAIDAVDLRIEDNEFFCIFGPPSCGKTSILKVFLGLVEVDSGQVLIDGEDLTASRPRDRDLGMVFQNLALFPHLTAGKNIAFPLTERRWPKSEIEPRVEAVAKTLHIGHLLHKQPAQLSGGERQRVAIARALVRDPKAYLMDEPIAALDARLRESTRVELKRLQRELNHTLVYVTHDQEEAMSIADRIAIMRDGAIVQVGTPAEIYNRPATRFVAEIVGSPRINLFEGRLGDGVFQADDLPLRLDFADLPEGPAALAIRPEDLGLMPPGTGPDLVPAEIYEVEPLGGHTVVDVAVGETILRAHLPGQPDYKPGEAVGLRIERHHCHVFDGHDGHVLAHAA
ncbi:MAG: ABC transporter ATP-binding protein [Rhodospirillales bacterium]